MRRLTLVTPGLVIAVVLAILVAGAALAVTINNGNFETGDLSGWTVVTTGSGGWYAYSGSASPLSERRVAAPPEGTFAAITDQTGPGFRILFHKEIALDQTSTQILSFFLHYVNEASDFAAPDTLDYKVIPNQQFRVDIMAPKDTDGRREDSGRGWVRELQGRWPGVLG